MKIIVSSEKEKELMERFIEQIYDGDLLPTWFSKDLDEAIKHYGNEAIDSTDADFITNGFREAALFVGPTIEFQQEDNILNGTCHKCNSYVEGTEDGDPISYDDYLEWQIKISENELECIKCYFGEERTEVSNE